jgi:hypothetical protein
MNRSESKHTPTPWKHAGRRGGWDGVTASDGTDICHLEFNNPANAAHIVLCVNAHPALAAALEALQSMHSEYGWDEVEPVIAAARAALSNPGSQP